MYELKTTANPDAMEVMATESRKTVATLRRNGDRWDLWVPDTGNGATVMPADVLALCASFNELWIRQEDLRRSSEVGRAAREAHSMHLRAIGG